MNSSARQTPVALMLLLAPLMAAAHSDHGDNSVLPETGISASSVLTYRSGDTATGGTDWTVPGAVLGGDAAGMYRGFALDDVRVRADARSDLKYSASLELAAHSSEGVAQVGVEGAWLTFDSDALLTNSVFEIGRMTSATTPYSTWHTHESASGEPSLVSDVMFARHATDTGARMSVRKQFARFGVELWNGDAWPASSGEGAAAVFYHWDKGFKKTQWGLSAWGLHSRANERTPSSSSSHSHGSDDTGAELGFSGSTDTMGVELRTGLSHKALQWSFKAAWLQARSEGELSDGSGQRSGLETDYKALSLTLGVERGVHSVELNHEKLVLGNVFLDSVSTAFLEQSGLQNKGHEPTRTVLAWRWQKSRDIGLRFAIVDDRSNVEATQRAVASVLWQRQADF